MRSPLKIHNLLKSGSDICSLRTAWVRVMKFFAWPDVPIENQKMFQHTLAIILTFLLYLRHCCWSLTDRPVAQATQFCFRGRKKVRLARALPELGSLID